jgi:hypothetical protein
MINFVAYFFPVEIRQAFGTWPPEGESGVALGTVILVSHLVNTVFYLVFFFFLCHRLLPVFIKPALSIEKRYWCSKSVAFIVLSFDYNTFSGRHFTYYSVSNAVGTEEYEFRRFVMKVIEEFISVSAFRLSAAALLI